MERDAYTLTQNKEALVDFPVLEWERFTNDPDNMGYDQILIGFDSYRDDWFSELTLMRCKSGKFAIPYKLNDNPRNYFCDFVVGKTFYEIKPQALHNTEMNRCKWGSARKWCDDNGFEFKVYSEYDFDLLKRSEIDILINDGKLILI